MPFLASTCSCRSSVCRLQLPLELFVSRCFHSAVHHIAYILGVLMHLGAHAGDNCWRWY